MRRLYRDTFLLTVYMAVGLYHNIGYGQEVKLPEEVREEVLSLPLGFYERDISIRERIEEVYITLPEIGWRISHHLGATVSEGHDDNIYDDEDNEIDDFITTVSPEVRIDFLTRKLLIQTAYRMDALYYQALSDELLDHTAGIKTTYRFSPRLLFTFSDVYRKTSSLKGIEGTDILPVGHTVDKSDENILKCRGEYNLIRGGNKIWVDYLNDAKGVRYHGADNDLASNEQAIGIGATHSFTRRTSVSPGFLFTRYRDREAKEQHYDAHGLTIGFNHTFYNLLEAAGKIGWEYRDYMKENKEDGVSSGAISLTSIFSRRTTIVADYAFDTELSNESSGTYDEDKFGAGISYDITRLLHAGVSGTYARYDYEDGKEQEISALGIALNYDLGNKLSMDLSYKFYKLASTTEPDEYTDSVYMVSIKTKFW